MKFIVSIILTALLSFCACLFFPWWSIAVVAFLVAALIPQAPLVSFISGFIALFLLWGSLSFWISTNNDHILAHRVSLLIFKVDNPFLLIIVTALIGALVGGFAALTAGYIRPSGFAQSRK
ncbi:hypothetical protein FW778_21710 [Ginsengibacter hankyongi]|uniref:Uncharacterized protein n=1 Tax=Ginsengibacter hankyongi TaxID=2607284 RepID=A0A5J5IBP9_9BACT|nr:hypothetical protein [Ginsengibacter hankyongi]KAA9034630.1 hypothetical protein FW778_21710 [Ginsengibacter hankyongi]